VNQLSLCEYQLYSHGSDFCLFAGELRMNPKDDKIKNSDDGLSPIFPILLLATLIIGVVLAIIKMIGLF
jgi:hypothetical protein